MQALRSLIQSHILFSDLTVDKVTKKQSPDIKALKLSNYTHYFHIFGMYNNNNNSTLYLHIDWQFIKCFQVFSKTGLTINLKVIWYFYVICQKTIIVTFRFTENLSLVKFVKQITHWFLKYTLAKGKIKKGDPCSLDNWEIISWLRFCFLWDRSYVKKQYLNQKAILI